MAQPRRDRRKADAGTINDAIAELSDHLGNHAAAAEKSHKAVHKARNKYSKLLIENEKIHWASHEQLHKDRDEFRRERAKLYRQERRFRELAHEAEHRSEAAAVGKAQESMERRLDAMNEIRGTLQDQAATFIRRETYDTLVDRVISIEKLDIKGEGKSLGQGAVIAAIVGGVSFAAILIGLVFTIFNQIADKMPAVVPT